MTSIIKWLKIIGLAILAIGAAVFVISAMRKKGQAVEGINEKLQRINELEHKTAEDIAEYRRLSEEKARTEADIQGTSNVYVDKIKELMKKPDEPKPGDASTSADGMSDAWGGKK